MRYCYWRLEGDLKKPYGYDEFQGIVAKGWQDNLLMSYADAIACKPSGYNIGFYIEPPYVAIDLDDVFTTTEEGDRTLTLLALHIISEAQKTGCYCVPSQSGEGYHIIGTLSSALDAYKNTASIEIYTEKRFIATTAPQDNEKCDTDITALVQSIIKEHLGGFSHQSVSKPHVSAPRVIDKRTFDAAIAALRKQTPDDTYEGWMRSVTAIANSFTGTEFESPALREVVAWSKRSPKYNQQALLHIRRYFGEAKTLANSEKPKITIGTLFHEHPECAPKVEVCLQDEFEVVPVESENLALVSEDSDKIVQPQELGALSYVHDVGLVVREFRSCGVYSIGGKEFFRHDGEKWVQLEGDFNRIIHLAKEFIVAKRYNWYRGKGGMAITEIDCVKGHGVLAQALREHLAVDKAFSLNSWMDGRKGNYLPVQNGILHIDANGSRLLPSNTGFFNLSVCETNWNGECTTVGHPTKLEQGLRRTFGGEQTAVDMWYNVMGLCLLNKVFAKKLILVQGASNAGKGQLTELLARLVGESVFTTTNEASLTSSFAFADLDRAAVCVIDELDTSYMNKQLRNALKVITSGGLVVMNQKMVRQRSGYVNAKIIITTNDTVEALRDPHGGLRQRLVCFNVSEVAVKDRVYDWARTVWAQEGAQILALAVARAERILREGVGIITTPEGSSQLLLEDIEEASIDPIVQWLRSKYVFRATAEKGLSVMGILAKYLATEHEKSSEHKYWMNQPKAWQGRNVSKKLLEAFPKAVLKKHTSGVKVYGVEEMPQFDTFEG